jgi:hypothetical protein
MTNENQQNPVRMTAEQAARVAAVLRGTRDAAASDEVVDAAATYLESVYFEATLGGEVSVDTDGDWAKLDAFNFTADDVPRR